MIPPDASLTMPVTAAVVTPCAAKGLADIASANSAPIAHARRNPVPRSIANSCYVEVSKEGVFYRAATDNRTMKRAARNFLTALRCEDPNSCSREAPKHAKQMSDKNSLRPSRALRSTVAATSPAPELACAAAALSGFAALVYEVAWTRLLALVIGPTTYAFATMAAAFIGGLAIGSSVGTRVARRPPAPAVWLAAMLTISAIAAAVSAYIAATEMPLVVAAQVADPNVAFARLVFRQAIGV